MKKITKKYLRTYIKNKLSTDDAWAKKAIKFLYSQQTSEEQGSRITAEHNAVGFSSYDATFLTNIAIMLNNESRVPKHIFESAKKAVSKYWRQILDACNQDKLHIMVQKELEYEKTQLNMFSK